MINSSGTVQSAFVSVYLGIGVYRFYISAVIGTPFSEKIIDIHCVSTYGKKLAYNYCLIKNCLGFTHYI